MVVALANPGQLTITHEQDQLATNLCVKDDKQALMSNKFDRFLIAVLSSGF
jgi:hypothetical protein